MSTQQLTDWFKDRKPDLPGVYESKQLDEEFAPQYRNWNGKYWGPEADTPDRAAEIGFIDSSDQNPEWRGLANDPNAEPTGDDSSFNFKTHFPVKVDI